MSEEFVRQSQLLDQIVLDRATMDECGRIEVMWCYPKVHRVLGFICKSGSFDRTKKAFNLDQLDKIGENGVLVNSEPVETDLHRVRQLETLIGHEVWTDEGKRVGRINDYVFQLGSGNIRFYLLASSGLQGLTGKLYSLYPNQILGYGRGRVMVSGGIVPGLELYQVGLDQKLEQRFTGLEERIERKLKRVADRLNEGLAEDALPMDLKDRAQSLFDRARSVTSEVGSRVKERAQEFLDEGMMESRRDSEADDDFDFEGWEEPQPPIAQRYSKRSGGFEGDRDREGDRDGGDRDGGDREDLDGAIDKMPRPPLNLTTPKTSRESSQESSQGSKSAGFTAIPRPSTSTESAENDPWDDDWG